MCDGAVLRGHRSRTGLGTERIRLIIFIVAPRILKSILFTQQQMHYLLNLERFKIYTKIQTNIGAIFV
jgi:hypothetical protein